MFFLNLERKVMFSVNEVLDFQQHLMYWILLQHTLHSACLIASAVISIADCLLCNALSQITMAEQGGLL